VRRNVPDPLAQHVLVQPETVAACRTATPRSFTNLTASSLNSGVNFRLPI
jgi:hypothetical protein